MAALVVVAARNRRREQAVEAWFFIDEKLNGGIALWQLRLPNTRLCQVRCNIKTLPDTNAERQPFVGERAASGSEQVTRCPAS
jgi:hypothetical protein